MKKYIAILALIAVTGCGGGDKNIEEVTTETESTTETETFTEINEETSSAETETEIENKENSVEKATEAPKNIPFEESDTYSELKALGENAGFETGFEDNTFTYKIYITDDTIDYINEKNSDYHDKWDENCGLYEEFCSEGLRIVKNSNSNINIALEVVGRSDNKVYYRNENGTGIYDAYVHESDL